jgi:hypothetical protein
VRLENLGMLTDKMGVLMTDYFTGRNYKTASERGPDGWALTFETPAIGFGTAVGAGGSPPSGDALDAILDCAYGANTGYNGTTVTSATSGTITTAASPEGVDSLLPITDAAALSGRMQVRHTNTASSPYTVDHNWDANPTSTGILRGNKQWWFQPPGGSSLSLYLDMDTAHAGQAFTLCGGRVTNLKLSGKAGGLVKWAVTMEGDNITLGTNASSGIAAIGAWAGSVIHLVNSAVEWGGTGYKNADVEIDFPLGASPSLSVDAPQGRSNIENLVTNPTVQISPIYAPSVWQTDFRGANNLPNTRTLGIKFGSGALAGGAVDAFYFWASLAEPLSPTIKNESNRLRNSVKLQVVDPGLTGSTPLKNFILMRT